MFQELFRDKGWHEPNIFAASLLSRFLIDIWALSSLPAVSSSSQHISAGRAYPDDGIAIVLCGCST